jgi:hypothetical protein
MASLTAVATTIPSQAPTPARPDRTRSLPPLISPITAPIKGPSSMPGMPKKGARTRAQVTGAGGAGDKINDDSHHGQDGHDPKGAPADRVEAVNPGADEQAGEHQWNTRQRRYDGARQAGHDDEGRQQPPEYRPVH